MKLITKKIKEVASQIGFDKVGVCPAEPVPNFPFYQRWIERGFNASMVYLERRTEERRDPANLLPGARSIVVCLVNYYWPEDVEAIYQEDKCIIARYARGQDYHNSIPKALKELGNEIEAIIGRPVGRRSFCDTSPVLERDFAVKAGLGWIGKNTCLVSDIGSWTFIGGLILDIKLEYDKPMENKCESCDLCLKACPTGALIEPFLLDSRRCLSYLTIEHKGQIEGEFKKAMGNQLFGCDKCQEACPYNHCPPSTNWKEFKPLPELQHIIQSKIKHINKVKFHKSYSNTSFLRAGLSNIQRNLSIILSNRQH